MKRGRKSKIRSKSAKAKKKVLLTRHVMPENHECFVSLVFERHDWSNKSKKRGVRQQQQEGTEFRLGVRNGQMFVDDQPFKLHPSSAQLGYDHFFEVTGDQMEHQYGFPQGPIYDILGGTETDEMLGGFVWALLVGLDMPSQKKYTLTTSSELCYGETRVWKLNTREPYVTDVAHKMFKIYRNMTIAETRWTKELHLKWQHRV
jgi:hypothetical protein